MLIETKEKGRKVYRVTLKGADSEAEIICE
jgi:hypothetical protein